MRHKMGTSEQVLLDSHHSKVPKHLSVSGYSTAGDVSISPYSGNSTFSKFEGDMDDVKRPLSARVVDSFRRDPNASVTRGSIGDHRRSFDAEAAAHATASSPLLRRLKGRHLQMIAIGGSIGTGLFVGTGRALAHGGPGSIFVAYCLIGVMMYCTVQALGEMAVMFPVAGSFAAYSTRFLDPAWGFAMGKLPPSL